MSRCASNSTSLNQGSRRRCARGRGGGARALNACEKSGEDDDEKLFFEKKKEKSLDPHRCFATLAALCTAPTQSPTAGAQQQARSRYRRSSANRGERQPASVSVWENQKQKKKKKKKKNETRQESYPCGIVLALPVPRVTCCPDTQHRVSKEDH
ncbi:hypothetical protein CAOG_009485 [Capsaspora owczarzaki ATCC 30864]|uniref:Uncharacterized protein n=1 Tax=Capsaspora owczarzaki (strain ATCC 30864) TaxID=595528 RepID=A0A0D2WKH4_CAPO3|nr:hypothetical protein CAOG_009485 [Capsaspora owczarzaki ATCC 30864]